MGAAGAIEPRIRVAPFAPADLRPAAEVLARAFHDQPLDRAVVGGSRRRRLRAERAGMRGTLEVAGPRGDVRVAHAAGLVGALVGLPPWAFPLPPPGLRAQLRIVLVQGLRVAGRWREVFDMLAERHPPEPVWYLSLLGVEPARQGHGVGTALLRDWLETVDAAGEPACLETAKPENLPFYRRHGFEVRGELTVFEVPVWQMLRPARAVGAAAQAG